MWSPTILILSTCHSPAGTLDLCVLKLLGPLAVDDLVNAEVILQRIHPGDVVVVGVLLAPNDASSLVLLALHCLERN